MIRDSGINLRDVKIIHADLSKLHADVWKLLLCADPSEALIRAYLSEEYTRLAVHADRYVGVYVLNQVAPMLFELKNIAIEKSYRGIGLGRRMLGHAIGLAEARGAREIVVSTGNSSLSNLKFYQRMGFRIQAVEPDYYQRHYAEPIIEGGLRCLDRLELKLTLEPE